MASNKNLQNNKPASQRFIAALAKNQDLLSEAVIAGKCDGSSSSDSSVQMVDKQCEASFRDSSNSIQKMEEQ